MTAPLLAAPETLGLLPTSGELLSDLPVRPGHGIHAHREAVRRVLDGEDDRVLAVVGPCSIHDPEAGLEYARGLAAASARWTGDLLVVLRAYLEKPRSVVGWKGLVHDPALDGSGDVAEGLRLGREFLLDAADTGLPLAGEFVEPLVAPYLADLVSYGAIGARTVASQPHRQLASWLPMPVGLKNAVDGDVGVAVDAIRSAIARHVFPGVGHDGAPAVQQGAGNAQAHLILRGGTAGTNYDAESVGQALARLRAVGLPERVVVDASHGNSGKDHRRQPGVVADLAAQIAQGQRGLVGVMVESFLYEGRQDTAQRYGVSITDACLALPETVDVLDTLAAAVRARRG
ncbi:3-deoxy-7-phosphoheptulonate synthase [Saccharothrix violaceirubra]|uniref:Phospho-2-dehydro-3-deoxyheptonate aldolase n=1 Tax=Saccharothrix violaceirubra TaxID=413306 RepID=A0A7W7T2S9_9PSEU|nr:3-deoxy-7-phosphoheptulonate synthase [Saccharothrix violaceirubra]MBB4965557.1 3-deoxy-7-phosphoheptulonate synthase [Saccharothrix violaceirubra]